MQTNDPAFLAYEALASIYNNFTHANDYEMWVGRVLLPELERRGLPVGGKVLDVACGTGRAFAPLLRRGWQIHGCDFSPAMLELAAQEGGSEVALQLADMRLLPTIDSFDLVLCLNDSVNYLLGDDDLSIALAAMRRNLGDGGLLLFDVNTRLAYSNFHEEEREITYRGARWRWRGRGEVSPRIYESSIEGDGIPIVMHRERFRPLTEVREALGATGLTCVAALGMKEVEGTAVLRDPPDEGEHYKVVFIARPSQGA